MHSFLILGRDKKAQEDEVNRICATFHISQFDKTVIRKEKSIGIEDIRILQKDLLLTPLESPSKAGIVYCADTMTVDAQNAFLKTLEEPPPNTLLMLVAENKQSFLPTVLSRCSIIQIPHDIPTPLSKTSFSFLSSPNLSIGEKLTYAERIAKNKEEALSWVEQGVLFLRDEMLTHPTPAYAQKIRDFQRAYVLLKQTNANTRVVLEHLFLSL